MPILADHTVYQYDRLKWRNTVEGMRYDFRRARRSYRAAR